MFCLPCIILVVFQYSETNVMHFSFSLLRIKVLYMFRALLAHPQKVCTSGTWYIACMLCQLAATRIGVELVNHVGSTTLKLWRAPLLFSVEAMNILIS
jgi:hypothetical protein